MTANVAVIIVNYGTADLAIEAVDSVLARDHGGREVEVHLVDNASPSGDAPRFSDAHAAHDWGRRVTLWLEDENHGFGRGNNVVLEALAARDRAPGFVFLLNPDARLDNEAIDVLAGALDAHPDAAVAGGGIVLPDGTPRVAAFRFPSLTREIVSTLNFGPLDRLLPGQRLALAPDHPASAVDWVAGAAVLFRFEALREAGFFDADFFLYFEEVELMRRITRSGHRVLYVPEARVIHAEGAATQVRSADSTHPRRPAYVYRSWWLYFAKVHGRGYALLTALLKLSAAVGNVVLSAVRGRTPSLPQAFFADHWRYAVLPLMTGRDA